MDHLEWMSEICLLWLFLKTTCTTKNALVLQNISKIRINKKDMLFVKTLQKYLFPKMGQLFGADCKKVGTFQVQFEPLVFATSWSCLFNHNHSPFKGMSANQLLHRAVCWSILWLSWLVFLNLCMKWLKKNVCVLKST